jgi:hypothetical protein
VLGSFLFLWQYHHGFDITVVFFPLQARLIEGMIDQVDGVVHVSWVQSRVLGIEQVESFRSCVTGWIHGLGRSMLSVEAETPDFFLRDTKLGIFVIYSRRITVA